MILILLLIFTTSPQTRILPQLKAQAANTTARLRGSSAVNERVAWLSGSNSTVLRTSDGGATWQRLEVTSDQLDFRDIDAVDEKTAYVLSIGNGSASRIYKTTNAGATWQLQFQSTDQSVFLDAMSFWDKQNGIVFGDSIKGQFYILITDDGGKTWKRVPPERLPQALENEGAFAASGTNIASVGTHAWIGTGAATTARVLHTADRGETWTISETPLTAAASAGIFSVAFRDTSHGVVVGGDYTKETEALNNAAITEDGGKTWKLVHGLSGYRSVVSFIPGKRAAVIAFGPSGGDMSFDNGNNWTRLNAPGFDTLSLTRGKDQSSVGWASGNRGAISKLQF